MLALGNIAADGEFGAFAFCRIRLGLAFRLQGRIARQGNRAVPCALAVVAQQGRAARERQGLTRDGYVLQLQGRIITHGRVVSGAGGAQRAIVLDDEFALFDQGRALIAIIAAQREVARAGFGQASRARATDNAGIIAALQGQALAAGDCDIAPARERLQGFVLADGELGAAGRGQLDAGTAANGVAAGPGQFQFAIVHFSIARVEIGARELEPARAFLDEAAPAAADDALDQGIARALEGQVEGAVGDTGRAGQRQGLATGLAVDGARILKCYRAVPGIVAGGVLERAAAQGQGFGVGRAQAAREFQRAARVDPGAGRAARLRRAQRVFMGNAQRARVHRGLAAVGVGRREADGSRRGSVHRVLLQAHTGGAREHGVDRAVLQVVIARAERERAFGRAARIPASVVNRAGFQFHPVKGVVIAREVKRAAGDQQLAAGVDGAAPAQLEPADLDPGVACVGAGAHERERARAFFGQAPRDRAHARCRADDAGNQGIARAVQDQGMRGDIDAIGGIAQCQGVARAGVGVGDGGIVREHYRAAPAVAGPGVAQRALAHFAVKHAGPIQGQAFSDIEIVAGEFQGRAVAHGDGPSARAQRVGVGDGEHAIADRGRARVTAVAAQGESGRAGLAEVGGGRGRNG